MSLALAAKHLESQGRNKDTKLVHMTPDELKALNKLSLDHNGKPLSVNPKTGLPEAGFLSSILPTVAGVAGSYFGFNPWLVAGAVGLGATVLSGGDIGQGIMAGLGAWSGGKLGADIKSAGNLVQNNAAAIPQATLEASNAVASTTGFNPSLLGTPAQSIVDTTGGLANIGATGTKDIAGNIISGRSASDIMKPLESVNIPPPDAWSQTQQSMKKFSSGADYAMKNPIDFLSRDGVGFNTAMALSPLALEALKPNYGTIPGAKQEDNPFGLKRLSPDFKGSFPTQPNPYYTAQYPDYRARPYGMNDGGLADIDRYKSKGKVDYKKQMDSLKLMQEGLGSISPTSDSFAPIIPRDPGDAMGGPGIVQYEEEYEGMTPDQRAYAMMKNIRKRTLKDDLATGLQPVGSLGALDFTPAAQRQAMLEEQAKQQIAQEAKSGGLMDSHLGDYSDGGRLLKGPGDGVSDSIPATIGGKQAARLAEGEFVIPARIVSELGNGSTDAGAKRLYAMMDRVKAKRRKAKDIAADTKAYKLLPA
jgi:hypothetical protein